MVSENLFKIFKTSDQSVFSHCENIAIKFILTLVHFFLIASAQKKKQSKRKKKLPKHKQENFLFQINTYLSIDTACTNYIRVTRVEFETKNVIRSF